MGHCEAINGEDIRYRRKLHWNRNEKSRRVFGIVTRREREHSNDGIAAYMKLNMNDDIFGESDGKLKDKQCISMLCQ